MTRSALATVAALLAVAAACSDGSKGAGDLAGEPDAAAPDGGLLADVTGRYASELALTLDVAGAADGGAIQKLARFYTTWAAYQMPGSRNVEVDTVWSLCSAPLPGLDVPYDALVSAQAMSKRGVLASVEDGATFTQPDVTFLLGARLAKPESDPLPVDAAHLCKTPTETGCVVPDAINGMPGLVLKGAPFGADIEFVSIVLRVRFALRARIDSVAGTLHGAVTSAQVEAHVVGCQRPSGAACGAKVVAELEARHPRVTVAGGALRSHVQGFYFTCPQLLADPEGSLAGIELMDAGSGADLMSNGARFSTEIQNDLDARGCATGGCHERVDAPAGMRLVFAPSTEAERLANYAAVLPWTTTGARPGGALVNQTPLPVAMRERWIRWIAAGAPY